MKKNKLFLVLFLPALSVLMATAQIMDRTINESVILNTKYTIDQVWDAQRLPSYPSTGNDWTLSGLKAPLDASTFLKIDWGRLFDRYLMFALDVDRTNRPTSLIDDRTGTRYSLSLKLFEADGRYVKTVSKWGKLIGIGAAGFMYNQEGLLGTFFPTERQRVGGTLTYRCDLFQVDHLPELNIYKPITGRDKRDKGQGRDYREAARDNKPGFLMENRPGFLNAKYVMGQVWDAQRWPAYPTVGTDWSLTGLKSPLNANRNTILDWGRYNDRYVMFDLDEDHSNQGGLIDDVNNSGIKYTVSLKLYESDGRFVETVSKWGNLIGFGFAGFMYEQEGQWGTFFSAEMARQGGAVNYRTELDKVKFLSQLMKDPSFIRRRNHENTNGYHANDTRNVSQGSEAPVNRIMDCGSIKMTVNKYSEKQNLSDIVQKEFTGRSGIADWNDLKGIQNIDQWISCMNLQPNQTFFLTRDGKSIFSNNRQYFVLYVPNGQLPAGFLAHDRIGKKLILGSWYGENRQILVNDIVNSNEVKKTSEPSKVNAAVIQNNSSRVKSGLIQNNPSREKRVLTSADSPELKTGIATEVPAKGKEAIKSVVSPKTKFDIFNTKYKIDQVWEVQSVESDDKAKVTYTIKGPAVYEHGGGDISINDWGKNKDRYMMFTIVDGNDDYWQIIDNITNKKGPYYLSVSMFEANGGSAGRGGSGYNGGQIDDLGSLGFVYWNHTPNSDIKLFFSKTPLKATDIITYTPIKKEVTKLSEIQPGAF